MPTVYCSRVGGKVRGWGHFCANLMGSALRITSRSFLDACYRAKTMVYCSQCILYELTVNIDIDMSILHMYVIMSCMHHFCFFYVISLL